MFTVQYDFNSGLDPSSLASLTQAQLLQMVQQIAPLSNIGGIITGAGPSQAASLAQGTQGPSVTNNPRFARYIWLNTFALPPVPYYYDGAGNWISSTVAAGSITNASISATAEIAVSKLGDGGANEIIVTAGDGVTVQWSSVNALLTALTDSVPLTAIDDSAASSGSFLRSIAGAVTWSSLATVISAIQSGLTPVAPSTIITPGANNTFVGTNGAGTVVSDTIDNIASNGAIGLGKLNQGGAALGDLMYWDGSSWVKVTPSLNLTNGITISTTGITGAINMGSATLTENFAHGLGATPRLVRAVIRCTAADAATGYAIGDEIDVSAWEEITGADAAGITVTTNATNVIVSRVSNSGANMIVVPRAGGNPVAPTALANFTPKVYAWL